MDFEAWKHRFRDWQRRLKFKLSRFPKAAPTPLLTSRPFTVDQLYTCWHAYWAYELHERIREHRKLWEFTFITQALYERNMLEPGKRGLGFGVGHEPLPALFASMGTTIVASDLAPEDRKRAGWNGDTRSPYTYLNTKKLCAPALLKERMSFQVLDMRDWDNFPRNTFDFCWSTGSLEHLGGIRHGEEFIRASLNALKPGGVAVHTTEFNLTSNDKTVRTGMTVLYRKVDIEKLAEELRQEGHRVELDWRTEWPMSQYGNMAFTEADGNLTIDVKNYAATSFGWIIVKGEE